MLRHAMVSEIPDGLSVQPPPPPGKLAAHGQLKLPFGDSCLLRLFSLHVAFIPGLLNVDADGGKGESWGA